MFLWSLYICFYWFLSIIIWFKFYQLLLSTQVLFHLHNVIHKIISRHSTFFPSPFFEFCQSIDEMVAKKNGKIICPRTGLTFDISQVKKAYVFWRRDFDFSQHHHPLSSSMIIVIIAFRDGNVHLYIYMIVYTSLDCVKSQKPLMFFCQSSASQLFSRERNAYVDVDVSRDCH